MLFCIIVIVLANALRNYITEYSFIIMVKHDVTYAFPKTESLPVECRSNFVTMPLNSFLVMFNFSWWLRSFMVVLAVIKVGTRILQTHKHTSVENELHNDYIEMLCNEYSHSFPRYQYFL